MKGEINISFLEIGKNQRKHVALTKKFGGKGTSDKVLNIYG
jgi:hypothetical protein